MTRLTKRARALALGRGGALPTQSRPSQAGRLVVGSIGDNPDQDRPIVPLDSLKKFGADAQYAANARAPYTLYPYSRFPWELRAGNKTSDHNIFNAWPMIVVGQYAGQTSQPDIPRIISRRIRLTQPTGGA